VLLSERLELRERALLAAFGMTNLSVLEEVVEMVVEVEGLGSELTVGGGTGPEGAFGAAFGSVCKPPEWADLGLGLRFSAEAVVLGAEVGFVLEEDEEDVLE